MGRGVFSWSDCDFGYNEDDEDDDYSHYVSVKDIYYEGTKAEWNSIRTHIYFDYDTEKDIYAGDVVIDEWGESYQYDGDFHDDYADSTIHFNYKPAAALAITQQPTSQTVKLGNSLKVSVKAEGIGLSYPWYYKKAGQTSWSVWKGRTGASETVTPNATWNGMQLYCVVKDSSNASVKSNTITVTVK